ncbi:MAG: PIN domain-containing protein [Thermoguttaceae bacterium]
MKVYLDTSFINYLVAPRQPDKMRETLALWKIFASEDRFELVISETVDEELRACYEPKKSRLLAMLSEIATDFVVETPEVVVLARHYIEFDVLHPKHYYDLLHIAHASVSRCQIIVSWNFKHFVNFKTMDRVNAVNLVDGYDPIRIVSPLMLLGELDNER